MKWIGQNIYDFISRFRGKVYVENDLEITGSITSTDDLAIIATGNDITIDTDDIKVTSATSIKPYLELENTNSNNRSSVMVFHKNHGAGVDNETLGAIQFKGYNDAGTPEPFNYATIEGKVADMTDGQEAGKLELGVVAYDGVSEVGLTIDGDTNADGEVDVTIGSGTASTTTIAGKLNMGSTAAVTNTTTSSATEGGKLQLQSNDGAAMEDNHRLGVIEFLGAENAISTYSVGARIQAICRDTWDGSNNDADLEFYTTDGTTESRVLTLDADKKAHFTGAVSVNGTITAGAITSSDDLAITATGNDITVDTDNFILESSTADSPTVKLINTTNDNEGSQLIFEKLRADDGVASGQNIGEIWFRGQDSAQNTEDYAYIFGEIDVSTGGQESGQLKLGLANHDGGNGSGLIITGGSADNEIDVTVGLGAASVTTITGTLTMGSTAAMTNAGLLSVANQTGITGVGTISSGVWQGTAIASAYLDSDTAHLTTNQTFTGVKTFNESINKKALHFAYTSVKFANTTATETYFSLADSDRDQPTGGEDGVAVMLVCPLSGILKQVIINTSSDLSSKTWEFRLYRVPSGSNAQGGGEIKIATVASNAGPASHTNKVISFVSATADTNVITYETGYDAETMFTAGDRVLFSLESNSDAAGSPKINAALCFELDESTI